MFTDDFTRPDSTTIGNGWFENKPSIGQILGNKLRCTGSGLYTDNVIEAPFAADFQDGTVSVDFKLNTASVPALIARMSGTAGTFTGIVLLHSSGTTTLRVVVNGAATNLDSNVGTVNASDDYRLTLSLNGNKKTGVLRNLTTAADISVLADDVNSLVTVSGKTGVSISSSGRLDYDNFISGILRSGLPQHNDSKLATLGSATINDGVLAFYLANGAVSQNVVDAAYEFLLARGVPAGSKNDMWHAFLTNITSLPMSGNISELKANWWANSAPLT